LAKEGWIKLHRKILDCWIWNDKPFDKGRAWIDLLLLATHKDKKMYIDNSIYIVERGSFFTSILKLADRWGWSKNKVVRFLDVLESEQMLYTKRTKNGTLVTLVKYEDYQGECDTDEPTDGLPDEPADEPADGLQNKNIKNIKNNSNIHTYMGAEDTTPIRTDIPLTIRRM
jgi:DNA replication protein DnaD